jgi:Ca-activated chloride channel homolog
MMKLANRSACLSVLLMAVAFTTLVIIGCGGGGGGGPSGGGGTAGSPEISLSTNQLSLGSVVANAAGQRSADRSVQVTNLGTANLVMGQIAQANPLVPPFSIPAGTDSCSGVSLAPNASCTVVVRFAPTDPVQSNYSDSFSIPSNDADEASLTVNVTGIGQGLNVTINKVDSSVPGTIRMIVSVTDGNNEPVLLLSAGNFSVTEGGVGQVINVTGTIATPVSVALDLDYSESVTNVLNDIEASAKGFLQNLTNPTDEASVIKYAREVREFIGFTLVQDNLGLFNTAIDAPYTDPINATKFFDAVYGSVDSLSLRGNDRKAILVVSDGLDYDSLTRLPASMQDLEDVIANAKEKQVFIFPIALGADIQKEVLQRMAVETGGQYFEAPTSADLDAIYDQISLILTNQYEITFTTAKAVGTTNSLRVVATKDALVGDDTESVVY